MAEKLIANPFIEINDVKIAVYGNSASYDNGLPDINVTAISAGGGTVKTVHGVDITTAVSMFKFKMPSTKQTDNYLAEWKANVGTNVIKFYEDDFQKTMLGASFAEGRDVELNASEGGIEITFKGDPMLT